MIRMAWAGRPGGIDELILQVLLDVFHNLLNETARLGHEGRDVCGMHLDKLDVVATACSAEVVPKALESICSLGLYVAHD